MSGFAAGGAAAGAPSAPRVLLIVSGGIAAYKALELIRLLRGRDIAASCVLTRAGAQFVTPLSLQALAGEPVHTELFSLTEESEMGHIALSRSADLVVVAPASADILARMAAGLADDLATTLLLATDTPVLVAPAMNVRMWQHPATAANLATLRARGVAVVGPGEGPMACNEFGAGRLSEPSELLAAILERLDTARAPRDLAGRPVLVTAGPTHEPIDPVRYLANRSSGKQGYAIAAALAARGASVTLVSGPVALDAPPGVRRVLVTTAAEMLAACLAALPVQCAVLAAAVSDFRPSGLSAAKIKKRRGEPPVPLALVETEDVLATLSALPPGRRPDLVVGFAAETPAQPDGLLAEAQAKRERKGCDWIVANDVSGDVMGGDENAVLLVAAGSAEAWPRQAKQAVAHRLAERIAAALGPDATETSRA